MIRRASALILSLSLVILAGCGGAKLVPAEGTITLDGKSLPNAVITFTPSDGKGADSVATSTAEGKFTLFTRGKAGAMPGDYKVTVTAGGKPGDGPPAELKEQAKIDYMKKKMLDGGTAAPPKTAEQLALSKFSQAATTPLTAKVGAGAITLTLISK